MSGELKNKKHTVKHLLLHTCDACDILIYNR